jgi:hypothetical protein
MEFPLDAGDHRPSPSLLRDLQLRMELRHDVLGDDLTMCSWATEISFASQSRPISYCTGWSRSW